MNWSKTFRVFVGVIAIGTVVGLGLWIGNANRARSTLCVSFNYPAFYESEVLGEQLGFAMGVHVKDSQGRDFPFFEDGSEHELVNVTLGIDASLGEQHDAIEREAIEAGWSKFQFTRAWIYSGLKVGRYKTEVFLSGYAQPFLEQWIEVRKDREFRLIELPRLRSIRFRIDDWEAIESKVASNGRSKVLFEILDETGSYTETSFGREAKGEFSLDVVDGTKYRVWLVSEVGGKDKQLKGFAFLPKNEPAGAGLPFSDDVFLTPEGGGVVQELPKFD